MTSEKQNQILFSRVRAIAVPALLALAASAVAVAQQPMVATAAQPRLHRVMQLQPELQPGVTPELAGQPEPPQANNPPLKEDLFAGTEKFAKNASDVSEITMDPDTLNLVGGKDAERARRTVLSVVRTYTYDKPGMYNPADVEEYRHKLESGDWHCSIHTRDMKTGESTDICSRRRPPDMIENAIITVAPKELTFIHSIKRTNGQGGSLDLDVLPGMGFLGGLTPLSNPEMPAEMAAAQAELKAHSAEMAAAASLWAANNQQWLGQLKLNMPRFDSKQWQDFEKHMQDFGKTFRITPEQQKELQQLGDQLNSLQNSETKR